MRVSEISIEKLEKETQCRPDLQKSLERFRARGKASEEKQKKFQELLDAEINKEGK